MGMGTMDIIIPHTVSITWINGNFRRLAIMNRPGVCRRLIFLREWSYHRQYTRTQIVISGAPARGSSLVNAGGDHASQSVAIVSIAGKIGYAPQTLHTWGTRAERDSGIGAGSRRDEGDCIKALEYENRELRQANDMVRKASAYFAQDRR